MVKRKGGHSFGVKPLNNVVVKSRKRSREITSKYHEIQNKLAITPMNDNDNRIKLLQELDEIGGVDAYQQASIVSTRHFNTSRWVVKTLNEINKAKLNDPFNKHNKLNVLEVGAINIQLHKYSYLQVRSIDLHSQHPSIEEISFFSINPSCQYDVVVCSMVINCVPTAILRFEMLARLKYHLRSPQSVLFLALPKRCIDSKYVGYDNFLLLLECLGYYQVMENRVTPKIIFYVLGCSTSPDRSSNWEGEVGKLCVNSKKMPSCFLAPQECAATEFSILAGPFLQ